MSDNWFEVDKVGLGKLLRRKGMAWLLYELVQNAWDTEATRVVATLVPVPGRPLAELVVEDDDPDGFKEISHAFTLFAESSRKGNAEQRGRFNLGEKLALAVCEEATISTTTGTIEFQGTSRKSRRIKREAGSEFRALIRLTRKEMQQIDHAATLLLPPAGVLTTYNGVKLEARTPRREITTTLPTEIAGEDGVLKRTSRKTRVRIYDRLPSEPARIYEMGIPVCATDDTFDVEVMQKVPLNSDRDNVTAGYLRSVRVDVLNAMAEEIGKQDAHKAWVAQATNDERAEPKAVVAVHVKRFGERSVDFDPRDKEANHTAAANGCAVVPSNAVGKIARAKLRQADALPMAGDKYPTNPGGKAKTRFLDEQDLTSGMRQVRAFTRAVSEALLGFEARVEFLSAPTASAAATYGQRTVSFNVGVLSAAWFAKGIRWEVTSLVLHELAHEFEASHLSTRYSEAVCDLTAKFAHIIAHDPMRFGELEPMQCMSVSPLLRKGSDARGT
jgi:hypothetical protein